MDAPQYINLYHEISEKAIENVFKRFTEYSKLILTESDLKCLLFLELQKEIEKRKTYLEKSQKRFELLNNQKLINTQKFELAKLHSDKFDNEVFYSLTNLGLAKREEGNWY